MKAPADQFYFADFLRDTSELSLAASGAWMKCLCKMWFSVTRGRISMPLTGYARMLGCTVDQAKAVIDEIREFQIGDAVTERNGNVTLTNRRMYRKWKEAEANKIRQFKHRAKQKTEQPPESNAAVTTPSSSSNFNNTHTLRAGDFDYPLRPLIEAFPDLEITPAQVGLIEAEVTIADESAWLSTIRLYVANHNRATRTYLPERVGTLLDVFRSEKRRGAKQNGTNRTNGGNGKATPAETIAGRPYYSAVAADPAGEDAGDGGSY